MTEDIIVTFIIPKDCRDKNDCSEDMKLAFTSCEHHCGSGLQAQWAYESKWNQFEGLTKRDVFVLTEFEGDLYRKLRLTKCLLVGPRCLCCCLTEGEPIPSGPEPVFTVAMRGLVITASGLSKVMKEEIKKKVHWMGGIYDTALTENTTHLVSDTVLSDKYIKSVEKGIPVMSANWIEAVWHMSLKFNINGASKDFEDNRLPPFANLEVTTSGLTKKDKQMIIKLVNENGGVFSGAFQSETTDIVVLTKEGMRSEKYKAALEYGKACVLPLWVKESAARGAAQPVARYRVTGAATSSPLAEHRLPDMSLNFSRITNLRPPNNFVDETRSTDVSTVSGGLKLSQESKSNDSSMEKDLLMAFENLDMETIKKAGSIFDGFCIWLTGMEGRLRECAAACVTRAGGVRADAALARVTHVVCARRAAAAAAAGALPAAPVLRLRWLLDSVRAARALDEAPYLIDLKSVTPAKSARKPRVASASPLSKRNLQLLRHPPLDLPPPTPEVEEPVQDEIVHHYLSQNALEQEPKEKTPEPVPNASAAQYKPDMTDDVTEEPTEEIEQIFRGMKLEVQGLDEDAVREIGAEVAAAGGVLVAAGAGGAGGASGSCVLVPLDFHTDELVNKDAEAVTVFWVKDCLCQQELVPIQYYHRPVNVSSCGNILRGVVASLSTYSGIERAFLDELAKLLGATTQLRFCRRDTVSARASTHLICPAAAGDKYAGALKWGLPAVTAHWLLQSAAAGRRLSERPFLVGDTKAPPSPEPPNVEENRLAEPVETNGQTNAVTDKENVMLPPANHTMPRRGSIPSREQTPKNKRPEGDNEMSPASRYIAMARQGLLGGDSQETPKRVGDLKDEAGQGGDGVFRTPPLEEALSTPNLRALSPTTRRRLQAVRRGEMPSDPIRTPTDPFENNPETPDSAFGAALRPGAGRLSPDARKRLWRVVHDLPRRSPQPNVREPQTPLSEIRNRFLAQFNSGMSTPPSEHQSAPRKLLLPEQEYTPPSKIAKLTADQSAGSAAITTDAEDSTKSASNTFSSLPAGVDMQLQRLDAALTSRLSSQRPRRASHVAISPAPPAPEPEPGPESQPNTVGWDDSTPGQQLTVVTAETSKKQIKRFMMSSNVDNREEIKEMIKYLGGEVSEGGELDPSATHLLCAAPGRSEKMLGAVAAGRWVLHPAYVSRSRASGRFLDEEEFEWGNPLATCLPALAGAEKALVAGAHHWRQARGRGLPGPFAGLAALLHVPPARRRLLARLVTAGGGTAVDDQPPYTNESITICFADIKRYPLSEQDAAWLKSRRIPVCAPVLLSSYLTENVPPNPLENCLPEFRF